MSECHFNVILTRFSTHLLKAAIFLFIYMYLLKVTNSWKRSISQSIEQIVFISFHYRRVQRGHGSVYSPLLFLPLPPPCCHPSGSRHGKKIEKKGTKRRKEKKKRREKEKKGRKQEKKKGRQKNEEAKKEGRKRKKKGRKKEAEGQLWYARSHRGIFRRSRNHHSKWEHWKTPTSSFFIFLLLLFLLLIFILLLFLLHDVKFIISLIKIIFSWTRLQNGGEICPDITHLLSCHSIQPPIPSWKVRLHRSLGGVVPRPSTNFYNYGEFF